MENLFKKQSAKFNLIYINRLSFTEVMVKTFLVCFFMPHSVVVYNSCFKLLVIISIMEWTDNKTKLLIEEFEKHPCLYNCKLDSYHNRDLRAVSWQRVAEVCGSTGMIPASKSPYFVEKAIISPGRTDTEIYFQSGWTDT